MSQKVLDVFFRHKFLIILPLVILTLAGAAASLSRQTTEYSSSANIWTQKTPLLTSSLGGQGGAFITPAGHQSRVLNDLLRLDSFRQSVADRVVGLEGLSPGLQRGTVREGTAVFASGVNVLTIRHRDEDPLLSQSIVQAIIGAYSETFQSSVMDQSEAAAIFYEARLEEASIALDESEQALASYEGTLSPTAAIDSDPELAAIQADARLAQNDYDEQLGRLEGIYLQRDAALEGRDLSFQVMDPPNLPSSPLPTSRRDLLMLPALGMLLGVSASGAVLFALTRLDDSIRLPGEARQVGAPVLAVVPELGRRRKSSWPQNFVRLVVAASRGLSGNLK
jgi:uncharacterized protein involved in exopolysaccharide biosynthesis